MRERELELPFIDAIFTEYWERDNGAIGEYAELRKIAARLGVDPDEFEAHSESDSIRQMLIDSTNNARAKGVFGGRRRNPCVPAATRLGSRNRRSRSSTWIPRAGDLHAGRRCG